MTENLTGARQSTPEPEFRAFRKRVLTGSLLLCIVGLGIGFLLKLPVVWGLAIAGIVVAGVKLATMEKEK